jgi:hypothetical protein
MPFPPQYTQCLRPPLCLVWYLCVCLQSNDTAALLYLFLHTVLRYFYWLSTHDPVYFLHLFKLSFLHSQLHPVFNTQFTFQFSCETLANRNVMILRPSRSSKNAQNDLWQADCIFKIWPLCTWSLSRTKQLSFLIKCKTFQQSWNRLRAL